MLVNVVGIEKRRMTERGQQILGDGLDQSLGVAVLVETGEGRRCGFPPVSEALGRFLLEGREFGMAEDGGPG